MYIFIYKDKKICVCMNAYALMHAKQIQYVAGAEANYKMLPKMKSRKRIKP